MPGKGCHRAAGIVLLPSPWKPVGIGFLPTKRLMQLLLAVSLLPPSAFHCRCSPVILGIDVSLQPMSHWESLFTSTASAAAIPAGVQGAQPPRCHAAAHPLVSLCHHLQCDLALLEAAWVGGLWMLEVTSSY